MIEKVIKPTIQYIKSITEIFEATIELTEHHLNNRIIEISKKERKFNFSGKAPVLPGLQTHREIEFKSDDIIKLNSRDFECYVEGKYILLNKIQYLESEKLFEGSITSFSTSQNRNSLDNSYLRCILPIGESKAFDVCQFQRTKYKEGHIYSFLIPIEFKDKKTHLYNYSNDKKHYLIVDSMCRTTVDEFQKIVFNILLALGFVKGNLHHDECFIFSYTNKEMESPEELIYHSMGGSILSSQPTFTTNAMSIHSDMEFEHDENGAIKKEVMVELYKDIIDFPIENFAKLCNLLMSHEKLQRSALLYLQGHLASLEMRIPSYFVAIEAITAHISKEVNKAKQKFAPIKNEKIAEEVINSLDEKIHEIKKKYEISDEDFNSDILLKNINRINSPPNADKLSESFTFYGLDLNDPINKEYKKILKDRNRYLHGSFLKTIDNDKAFREALHVSLRLRYMIAFLILKLCDFDGAIINYASLWKHITEKEIAEKRLLKI